MPSRIIREGILTSDRVNRLDWASEIFYRRLMSKVDDHGVYDGRLSVLQTSLYPLKISKVKESDISKWLGACQLAGLLVLYVTGGKPYIQMVDTKWQIRGEPKCPLPTKEQLLANENIRTQQLTAVHLDVVVGVFVSEVGDVGSGSPPDVSPFSGKTNGHSYLPTARAVLQFLNEKAERRYQPLPANLDFIVARLKDGATETELRQVIAKKTREWKGNPEMSEYLRPATLFNKTKFAQYQGELGNANGS